MRKSNIPAALSASIGLAASLWGAAVLAVSQTTPRQSGRPAAGSLIDFQRQVQPILEASCSECHSQDRRKGGLSLATYDDVLEGGRSGAAVRPGNSANSLIVHRITGLTEPQMPKDEVPLDAASIALVRLWIDQGARATPASAPAPAALGSAAGARSPGGSADSLALVVVHDRSLRRRLHWRAWGDGTSGDLRCAVRPARLSGRLGSAPEPGRVAGFPGRPLAWEARRARRDAARRTTRNTPTTGSRSGMTCCETKTASRTFPRRRAARASPTGCIPRSSRTSPTTSSSGGSSAPPRRPIPTGSSSASTGAARRAPRSRRGCRRRRTPRRSSWAST